MKMFITMFPFLSISVDPLHAEYCCKYSKIDSNHVLKTSILLLDVQATVYSII